jgi:3-methyladenine DNA glycosylase/8-oxoguanine DNA glycosylase
MKAALDHLQQHDPALGEVIRRVGPYTLAPAAEGSHFEALLRAIVYQQLSGKAAATIHGRVLALFSGGPDPKQLLALPEETLRAAGLSRQKVASARALAERFASDPLPHDVSHLSDDELIKALSSVRGIGRWSAQMFLMFRLGRLDVLPDADLGIQKGIQRLDRLETLPTPKQVVARGQVWRPYATVASWYLWRSLELH